MVRTNRTTKRIFVIFLSVLMVLTLIPVIPGMLLKAQAYGETTTESITIKWIDGGATDRPSTEIVKSWLHLWGNGSEVTGYSPEVTDNHDNTYSVLYRKLLANNDQMNPITYEITEEIPDEYANVYSSSSSFDESTNVTTVTNLRLKSIPVSKNWIGMDGTGRTAEMILWRMSADGVARNTGLTIELDGTADSSLTLGSGEYSGVLYGEDSAWHGVFSRLPAFDNNGNAISYDISENTGNGSSDEEQGLPDCYPPIISGDENEGYTVTNISSKTCSIHVNKVWKGTSEKVTVNLFADGTKLLSVELDGMAEDGQIIQEGSLSISYGETAGWVASFDHLPKYHPGDGHEIHYTISEDPVSGVNTILSDPQTADDDASLVEYTITNVRPESVTPTVQKQWKDTVKQSSVELTLQRKNGDDWVSVESITLDGTVDVAGEDTAGGQAGEYDAWKGRFSPVEKYDTLGVDYVYRVIENTTGNWYAVYTGSLEEGFTVTNTPKSEENPGQKPDSQVKNESEPASSRTNSENVKTGDASGTAFYLFIGLWAVVAAFFMVRKRAENNGD